MLVEEAAFVQPGQFHDATYRSSLGRIVLCKGVYDLTHAGHVESFRMASAEGDTLVVGLATDESVHARKGHGRPILTLDERVKIIRNIRVVDIVTTYDETTPFALIEQVRPAVFCATHVDWLTQDEEIELANSGIEIRILPRPSRRSTSEIIRAITSKS